jgi:DNA-binding winged helix-turn-helix (wHTH) protein/Tfp pilus assembly protein PilF
MLARMDALRLLDLHIDRAAQQVRRGDVVLPVSGLSWRLLDCLLSHGTDVVAFDTLAEQVWAPAVVGEDAISQRVKLLRQALGDDSRQPRYIRSVRGRGYQLCAPVQPAVDTGPFVPRPQNARRVAWLVSGMAFAVLAVGIIAWPRSPRPSPAAPLLQRAAHYAEIGQASNNARAIDLYRQALRVDPDSREAQRGLARGLAAEVCLFNGGQAQADESLRLATQLIESAPEDAVAWATRGYAYDCRGQMPQAIADYRQALQRDPGDERTRASLAYLHQEQGLVAQALQANLSLRAPERVRFRDVQVARELELLGFIDAAARRHARSFQLYPDNVFANIALPRSLLARGEPAQAQLALAQALARGTPHPDLYRLQGELRLLDGDVTGAADAFERSRQLRPQQSMGQTLAILHAQNAPTPEAIAARLREVQQYPDDGWSDAALERALLLQAQGDTGAALTALHAAVDTGFRDVAWLKATPLFAPLRKASGWQALLDRIEADIAAQREQVLRADWCPEDLRPLSATRATGTR